MSLFTASLSFLGFDIQIKKRRKVTKYHGDIDNLVQSFNVDQLKKARDSIELRMAIEDKQPRKLMWYVADDFERIAFREDYLDAVEILRKLAVEKYSQYDDPKSKILEVRPFWPLVSEYQEYLDGSAI